MTFSTLVPSLDLVAFAAGLVVIVLGLLISGRACQGFRRNESRPMLLFAIGMVLITVIPTFTELILIPWFVARYTSPGIGAVSLTLTVSRLCEVVGIGFLIYSLHIRRS